MKTEISAGGVVVRKYREVWQVLLMKDMNNAWTFPKGLIEKGEGKKQAAEREIKEEVGLTGLTSITPVSTIHYAYRRNGVINKTVHYFLFSYLGDEKPRCQISEGIKDARWLPFSEANTIVGYKDTSISLLKKAETLLRGI